MSHSMSFSYQASKQNDDLVFTLGEVIDESFDIPLNELASTSSLHVEMGRVSSLNSEGTRRLTKWLWDGHNLYPKLAISLSKVPPVVAKQLMAVRSFVPEKVTISSLLVPFYCEACDLEDRTTLVNADDVDDNVDLKKYSPEPPICKLCNKPMELDVIPEMYFALFRVP